MEIGSILAAGKMEGTLAIVIVQVALILVMARVFAEGFKKLGQPGVVGEIVAGLVLGPSVWGKIEKAMGWDLAARVFDPSVSTIMQILAQLGLVLLLFLIGLEFDFSHLRRVGRTALTVSAAGVVLPFVMGFGLGWVMFDAVGASAGMGGQFAFALFMGTAMSITALPILGRMLMEMGLSRTKLAALTITSAAIDDAVGWILLATVTALAMAKFHAMDSARMLGLSLAFAALMIFVVRPVAARAVNWALAKGKGELSYNALALVLAAMLLCSLATSKIGIFAIFGAFMFGAILSGQHAFREAIHRQMGAFVTVFFLPIFFTYTGLRTDIDSVGSIGMWGWAAAVMGVAILGKLGGCTAAARFSGLPWREAGCVGILMNTRALMELVVINVGYDLGVIPRNVFCMLVLMAVGTTVMTTPILKRWARRTELEEGLVASGFAKPWPKAGKWEGGDSGQPPMINAALPGEVGSGRE